MDGPDVRWDGVRHEQIVSWTSNGTNAEAADALESLLQSIAETLSLTADMVNTALQQLHSGEWSGAAATVTAQAMRHLRDFDDVMSHHSNMSVLAVAGQSGNANWAKSSVPPVVDIRPSQMPTGDPMDVLDNTRDYQHLQAEAKDAEEQARQVMRQYHAMSVDRIAALPLLSPAPQVVIDDGGDTITMPVGPKSSGGDSESDPVQPRGGNTSEDVRMVGDDGTASSPTDNPAHIAQQTRSAGTDPSEIEPSTSRNTQQSLAVSPTGTMTGTDVSRTATAPVGPTGGPTGTIGGPDTRDVREPLQPRGGQPVGAAPRGGEPWARGAQPGTGTRTVAATVGRLGVTHGSPSSMAPFGTPGAARSDENKDHQRKYGIPGSEVFEPDHHDGVLCDPYSPGAYVAPASIGDEDDE